jgi:Icc-related predicted phosphoesterase
MLIQILSDLHLEFETFEPPRTDCDLVVLAGDIHIGNKGLLWAKEAFADKPVIYVLGNHEYYRNALPKLTDKLKQEALGSNVHILENDKVIIDDVVFLGCTLWTNFELLGDPRIAGYEATQQMTDYKKIRVSPQYRKLRSIDTAIIHRHSLDWLKKELSSNEEHKVVIITHHAPSKRSLPQWYAEDLLSAAYASDLEKVVESSKAKLWIHGHIHAPQDYVIGNTRVVCNPKGYPDEYNDAFIPDYVVQI